MKKAKLLTVISCVFLAIFCLTMVACSGKDCATPTNVAVSEDLMITWEPVDNATNYMIAFNGDTKRQFMVETNEYNLKLAGTEVSSMLASGEENTVAIRACTVELNEKGNKIPVNCSAWSESATFLYSRQVAAVKTITYDSEKGTLEWRKSNQNGAYYKLGIKEKNSTEIVDEDLSSYTITPNFSGKISFEISNVMANKPAKVYEIALKVCASGYEDSEYSNFVEVDLTGGIPVDPEDPEDPEDPVDPEDPEDPDQPGDEPEIPVENGALLSIEARYTGGELEVGVQELDTAYVLVKAIYENNANGQYVYDYTTDIATVSATAGTKTVTITYTEGEVTKTATISVTFVADISDPADPSDQPDQPEVATYKLFGINLDWDIGIKYNQMSGTEFVWTSFIIDSADGEDAIKIVYGENYYGFESVKEGAVSGLGITADGMNNIVLANGEYTLYFDYTVTEGPMIWIQKVVTHTLYFKNTAGWATVKAYAWSGDGEEATTYLGAWPGTAISPVEGKAGWYSVEVKGAEKIIFNDGGSNQTSDLTINENKTYFQFGASDWTSSFDEVPPTRPATITVYFYNAQGWSGTINTYAWSGAGTTHLGSWPGTAMTAVAGKAGWYSITVSGTADKIIFNNGSSQTADLIIDLDNLYYKNGSWTNGF